MENKLAAKRKIKEEHYLYVFPSFRKKRLYHSRPAVFLDTAISANIILSAFSTCFLFSSNV